jgi:hypothetical protein
MRSISQHYPRTGLITPQTESELIRDVACMVEATITHDAKPVVHVKGGREACTVQINLLAGKRGIPAEITVAAK